MCDLNDTKSFPPLEYTFEERLHYYHSEVCLFYYEMGRNMVYEIMLRLSNLLELLRLDISRGYDVKHILLVLYKIMLHTRDCRYGKGERDMYYAMLWVWYCYYPSAALSAFDATMGFGKATVGVYYKDLRYLCEFLFRFDGSSDFISHIIRVANRRLYLDCSLKKRGEEVSNICKWIPRESSGRFGWLFDRMVVDWCNMCGFFVWDLSYSKRYYRKMVAQICLYCGLKLGEKGVHKGIGDSICHIVKEAILKVDICDVETLNRKWVQIRSYNYPTNSPFCIPNMIPILDLSENNDYDTLYRVIGFGIFVAERSLRKLIILGQYPQWVVMDEKDTFFSMAEKIWNVRISLLGGDSYSTVSVGVYMENALHFLYNSSYGGNNYIRLLFLGGNLYKYHHWFETFSEYRPIFIYWNLSYSTDLLGETVCENSDGVYLLQGSNICHINYLVPYVRTTTWSMLLNYLTRFSGVTESVFG
jgi:hypothetical protein